MRFIGNKEKLLKNIRQAVESTGITEGTFCDFFSGTSNVGRYFKELGFEVISSDMLHSSYVLQEAYIRNNDRPLFSKLLKIIQHKHESLFSSPLEQVISYLNQIDGVKGFIYTNYTEEGSKELERPRKFFTPRNGMKIDAIRQRIEFWKKEDLINNNEYYILLACLIESVPFFANISGVYAAFLKKYDPRALKDFKLKEIKIYEGIKEHRVYNKNSMDLIKDLDVDILYLDPPYNERQYGANYHLIETISRYDSPIVKGVTGMRNYSEQKSEFCNSVTAIKALDKIARDAKYKYLILSYNSEGIMSQEDILNTLKKYGQTSLIEIDYLRFKSNSKNKIGVKKHVKEQLYLLEFKAT